MSWRVIAGKDLREELRGRETLMPTALVSLLVLTVVLLAFHDVHERVVVASATWWLALAFGAGVGLARALGAEKDRGTLETLLTLPVERGAVFLGKAASAFVTLLVVAFVAVAVFVVAEGGPVPPPALALFLVLGAAGLASVGTLLSALAANTRARDLLLPVLMFPVLVPLLISGIHGTMDVLGGEPFAEWRPELLVLAGYDLIVGASCWFLFDAAVGP